MVSERSPQRDIDFWRLSLSHVFAQA